MRKTPFEDTTENAVEDEMHLLDKESFSEDEDWITMIGEEDDISDNKTLRYYLAIGVSISFVFLIIRLFVAHLGHGQPMPRSAEKLYFNGTEHFASTVLLISLSGFKPDYLNRTITPHLNSIVNSGVRAEKMYPVYPPNTLPNMWTLATGLYPETHGIVDNSFYDPNLGVFEYKDKKTITDRGWWKGVPIWLNSRINRQKTASIMWPGSNTYYNTPNYVVPSSGSVHDQMKTVLNWLDLPYNYRPQMFSIHVPQSKKHDHIQNPDSQKMNDYIKEIDDAIGYLIKEISNRNLDSHIHTVIVSDHGMAVNSKDKLIYIDDILPPHLVGYVTNKSPSSNLCFQYDIPLNVIKEIYNEFMNHNQTNHFKAYLKENMPVRYHHMHSDRIFPIKVIPEDGYQFITHSMQFKERGDHEGYDNLADSMNAIFLARGPKISKLYKPGTILAPFVNIEVYGFLTELLNIDSTPNNGTMGINLPVLYEPHASE